MGGTSSTDVVDTPIVVSQEATLAHEFLGALRDPRLPWLARYEEWADERRLDPELARSVRVAVLKIRMFGAIQRAARRRP